MNLEKVVEKFLENPNRMIMGKGKLSKRWKCSPETIVEARRIVRKTIKTNKKKKFPKILVFDIETAPVEALIFRAWKQNVYPEQITSDWFLLTFSAKWLFSSDIISFRLTGEEARNEDDSRLVFELWKLMDEADMVVAHNGKAFDVPKANVRFLMNGLHPPRSYQQIDTKIIAAKQFGFMHNSLNGLAKQFGFEAKMDTDFELWKNCRRGDETALKYMEKYNRYDVKLLEDVYLKIRAYIKSHPNVGLYIESDESVCATCGSEELIPTGGYYYTQSGKYPEYRCECGALTRGRHTVYDKNKRKNLVVGTAR